MSRRTRLRIGMAIAVLALSTLVAVAWADDGIVYFVGDNACHEFVAPNSDQIDDGWSYDHYVEADAFIDQCNDILGSGYIRAYGNKSNGSWPCGNTGYGDVVATCPTPYPYVRAHCVNLSSSSWRWMSCDKIRRFP